MGKSILKKDAKEIEEIEEHGKMDWEGKVVYHIIPNHKETIQTMTWRNYLKEEYHPRHMVRCPELGLNEFYWIRFSHSVHDMLNGDVTKHLNARMSGQEEETEVTLTKEHGKGEEIVSQAQRETPSCLFYADLDIEIEYVEEFVSCLRNPKGKYEPILDCQN